MKKQTLSIAIQGVLSAALIAAVPTVHAQEDDQAVLEEIFVTGSRIKRPNMESSSPVEVITSQDLIEVGRFSVADALRSNPANSFGSFVPASGSSAQSQATVNLLGLGSERTLVLLNGLRLPGSPSLGGTSVNINQIPMAMVSSIEILKGGASAVYGSDAVAGVVNILLKEDYEGLEFNVNYQEPDAEGGEASDFSFVTGISSDRGNITFAYEHAEQKPIFDVSRPYTAPSWEDTDGNGVFDRTVGVSSFGASILNPNTGLYEASPLCDSLTENVPGFVGETEDASGNRYCGFAYAGVSANQASTNRDSIFVTATYDISDSTSFFSRAIMTHNSSFGRYAPPAAEWAGGVPVGSPHNPYDVPVEGRFRWHEIGNRDGKVDDYSQDYIAGLEGRLFDALDYEVYYHHNTTDNKQVGEFYLSQSGLAYNIANGIDLGSPEGVANMRATTLTQDRNRFDQLFAGFQLEAGDFGAGSIFHYFGAEAFDVRYDSIVDAQSEAGQIGGSAGNTAGRGRENWAVFYESVIPVASQAELELAVRYDDYSDFGSEVSPQISGTYRPTEQLMIRASYGQGFRAPDLQALSQADSFAADFATDYVTCLENNVPDAECPERQYNTFRLANPNLTAETSTSLTAGLVYEGDAVSVSLDYFNIEIEDAIRFVPIQQIVFADLLGVDLPSPDLLTIDRSVNAANPEFTTATINGPGLEVSGLNLSAQYLLEIGAGAIDFDLESVYFVEYSEDNFPGGPLQDKAGWSLQPQYKVQFTTSWTYGDHSLSWNMDFTPSTSGFETPDLSTGLLNENDSNDSFLVHNVTYSFDAGSWGQYRLGLRNLTDEDPVLDSNGTYANGYDALYSSGHIGRLYSLGATWKF